MTAAWMRHRLVLAWVVLVVAGCGGGSSGTIGGTVNGLNANVSVVLQDDGGDLLTVTANGSFAFPTALDTGVSYAVAVAVQPSGQSCTVSNGSGAVDGNDDPVDTVLVTCTTLVTLSGTVSGLAPGTSVTLSNGQVLLPIAGNGAFSFPGIVTSGTVYNVTVAIQPAGGSCTITNGSGTVPTTGSPAIGVVCS